MSRHKTMLALAVLIAVAGAMPAQALAEGWEFSVGAYGGLSHPDSNDWTFVDPVAGADFTAKDVSLKDSGVFGGKVTAWSLRPFGKERMNFGVELEVMQYRPNMKTQQVDGSGAIAGVPVIGVVINAPAPELRSQLAVLNILWRYPMGVTSDRPSGIWYPYVGIGGGLQRTRLRDPGGVLGVTSFGTPAEVTSTSPVVQFKLGLNYSPIKFVSLFGEYKYTHAEHTFKGDGYGTTKIDTILSGHMFVGGVSLNF